MKIDHNVLRILERLLAECNSYKTQADIATFRRDNYSDIGIIEWLEQEQYIVRNNSAYELKLISFSLLQEQCVEAKKLLKKCESIFPLLKQHYLEYISSPLAVANIAKSLSLSIDEVLIPLSLVCESSIVGGKTTNLTDDKASVFPAEKILAFENFIQVLEDLKSMREIKYLTPTLTDYPYFEGYEVDNSKTSNFFVHPTRVDEIRRLNVIAFDLRKVVQICLEMNKCYESNSYLSLACLQRMLLDHIPPIFDFKSFTELANNFGSRSFKQHMMHLEKSLRKISDSYLHQTIRRNESLPNIKSIDFSSDIDVLLGEMVIHLKNHENDKASSFN
jgi:hypothetical protein